MIYLLLSIFCNAILFLILKYFERFRINNLQAIVTNYICACTLGLLNSSGPCSPALILHATWMPAASILGCMFIVIFLLIAKTAQEIGVSVATVANKMSVIIPVSVALILYHDHLTILKMVGIALALVAVFLTSRKAPGGEETKTGKTWMLFLPFIVFLGSGTADALVNYSQKNLVPEGETSLFVPAFFAVAGTIGIIWVGVRMLIMKERLALRNLIGGVALGIPNYFSIYFMILALHTHLFESSVLYPLNNMGIVLLSAGGGLLLFREKLSAQNLAGIGLSILAIALIAFS